MADTDFPNIVERQRTHARILNQVEELAEKIRTDQATHTMPILRFMEVWMLCRLYLDQGDQAPCLKPGGY